MEINNEKSNKKGLGRGLGSLLGDATSVKSEYPLTSQKHQSAPPEKPIGAMLASEPTDSKIWKIAIDKIVPGVYQPRRHFDKETIQQLAQSIKENGILQPIAVRKRSAGGFEIIAGERRWRAAQAAGLHEVPAIIKELSDKDALQLAIIENVQREDLDPIEEAESYQRLMQEFSYSQQDVAEKVGKERSTVANALRLLVLPNILKDMLAQKTISVGHAKALLSINDEQKQIKLAKYVEQKGLSVRALEAEIKKTQNAKAEDANNRLNNEDMATKLAAELAEQLQKSLGTKVNIDYRSGKGQVHIHFYSDDQLTDIYDKLNS